MIGLSNIVTPKIEREAEARNYGKFIISPLEHGYGVTLGNGLRRVLLSSLEGAAVTSIRIADVQHEFSDIPGVREDVIHVMLQIKQLRMKLYDVDTARLHLEVRGSGAVTAGDIITPPEVEIINPDLYLFTVDDKDAHLEMEMTVERGRGYSPADDRSGRLPIGELPVDAIYSPVRRVNWRQFIKPKIVISKCVEFDHCRYDGSMIPSDFVNAFKPHVDYKPVCPEMEIGLGVPRSTVRIVLVNGEHRLIQPTTNLDVTDKMRAFSSQFLNSLAEVDGFILKFRSPSCGLKDIKVYSGTAKTGTVSKAPGFFGGVVIKSFPDLAIEDEGRLRNFNIREHFLTKL